MAGRNDEREGDAPRVRRSTVPSAQTPRGPRNHRCPVTRVAGRRPRAAGARPRGPRRQALLRHRPAHVRLVERGAQPAGELHGVVVRPEVHGARIDRPPATLYLPRVHPSIRRAALSLPGALLAAALARPQRAVAQPAGTPPPTAAPSLRAGALGGALRLDGRLDEPAWAAADSIADLTQIEPRTRAPPPSAARSSACSRRARRHRDRRARRRPGAGAASSASPASATPSFGNEDHVKIVLDTYLDGRIGLRVRREPERRALRRARRRTRARAENANWDAVVGGGHGAHGDGLVGRDPHPDAQPAVRARASSTWGFNVQRRVQRAAGDRPLGEPASATTRSRRRSAPVASPDLPPFDARRRAQRAAVGHRGRGRAGAARGLARATATRASTSRSGSARTRSRRSTVNTDFAETEVDTRRTNLTRFPLVFPEKRTFFLAGRRHLRLRARHRRRRATVLQPAHRAAGRQRGADPRRREGERARRRRELRRARRAHGPPARRRPRHAAHRRTRSASCALQAERAARVDRRRHRDGGRPARPRRRAGSAGADATYQTSRFRGDKNFLVGAWGLATDREGLAGERARVGREDRLPERPVGRRGDVTSASATASTRRSASCRGAAVQIVDAQRATTSRGRRGRSLGLRVRQMFNEFLPRVVTDLDGRWESYRVFIAPVNWRLESGDRFELNVRRRRASASTAPFTHRDRRDDSRRRVPLEPLPRRGGDCAPKRRLSGQAIVVVRPVLHGHARRAVAHRRVEAVVAVHRRS